MDSLLTRSGEGVARLIGRRHFLTKIGVAAFGAVAASAAGMTLFPTRASASICSNSSPACGCTPPNRTFCNTINSSYCSGSSCAGGCQYWYHYWPNNACWCTQTCCNSYHQLVYYQCCDCTCGTTNCGCSQLVNTCAPISVGPDGIPLYGTCC